MSGSAQPDAVNFGAVVHRRGIDLCAALRAKSLLPRIPALRCFYIDFRRAAIELQLIVSNIDDRPISGSGQNLAIDAVTDGDIARVDFSFVAYVAAMTGTIDLHAEKLPT